MKHPFYISLLLSCMLGIAACTGPVIIEEENVDKNENVSGGSNEEKDSVAIIHEGTYSSPYSIAEAQALGHGKGVWVEGYIVGSVSGSMKSGCVYTLPTVSASNILLADTFPTGSANDHLHCMPIELPNGSIERDELNLYDNPDNYHCKVRIEGDITLYYKVVGIKNIMDYTFGWENENKDENEDGNEDENGNEDKEPDTPHDPDATTQDTLTIAEGIKMQKEVGYEQAHIRGYIVGYAKASNSIVYLDAEITPSTKAKGNIVLADDINERDNTKVIVVELPKKNSKEEGYLREEVSLYNNPQNLHKRLTVTGMMTSYYGLAGCTGTLGTENRERFHLE